MAQQYSRIAGTISRPRAVRMCIKATSRIGMSGGAVMQHISARFGSLSALKENGASRYKQAIGSS